MTLKKLVEKLNSNGWTVYYPADINKKLAEKLKSKGWIPYYPADINKTKEHKR